MTKSRVLITGCSSGIGRSLCEEFQRQGYPVIATARRRETITDLESASTYAYPLDVTQPDQIRQLVHRLEAEDRLPDILINNAGYGLFGPVMDLSPDAIAAQFDTNVVAPMQLVQAIAPFMKAQGSGLILNIASVSSVFTTPFAGAYCGSKAALRAMSTALRMELAPFGIQVVTVHPGAIASDFGNKSQVSAAEGAIADTSWYAALADDIPEVRELACEPVLASATGAEITDSRVRIGPEPSAIDLGPRRLR